LGLFVTLGLNIGLNIGVILIFNLIYLSISHKIHKERVAFRLVTIRFEPDIYIFIRMLAILTDFIYIKN
jgi:hypothetical protein